MSLQTTKKSISNDHFFTSVEELLAQGLTVDIKVKGYSMRPFLRNEQDSVRLRAVSAEELVQGDVVLFRNHGHHTLHRYYGTEDNTLIFKGDGNPVGVERVTAADVVAVVESVTRPEGTTMLRGSKEWQRATRRSLLLKKLRKPIFQIKRVIKQIIRG